MLREYVLEKTPNKDVASIEVLGIQHLAQVLALQDDTHTRLSDEQKMFVLLQSPQYFERLLKQENGRMIGVRVKGQLVAHMALMGKLTVEQALYAGSAVTRNEVRVHHAEPTEMVAIAKSMAVHPDWRGHELSQHMLRAAIEQPMAREADHMFAQVSAVNKHSWEMFLREGFGIVAAAIDPEDKMPRFVLQRPALGFALHDETSVGDIHPVKDFTTIMGLTDREALIGRLGESYNQHFTLKFQASRTYAASWAGDRLDILSAS